MFVYGKFKNPNTLFSSVEDSIVNAPLVRLQSKNTNNAKSEVRFK
jgi:hypothetical protein